MTLSSHNNLEYIKFLSSGSYGKVYKCKKGKKTVAVKEMERLKSFDFSPIMEIAALKFLNSFDTPYIISIYDIFCEKAPSKYLLKKWKFSVSMEEGYYTMTDYCQLSSLETRLSHCEQLSKALCYLHSAGFIHCDIKPDNIMSVSGELKLIDFSSTCWIGTKNTFIDTMGLEITTASYRAPEITLHNILTKKSDIWSMACVVYFILTKTHLFEFECNNEGTYNTEELLKAQQELSFTDVKTRIYESNQENACLHPITEALRKAFVIESRHRCDTDEFLTLCTGKFFNIKMFNKRLYNSLIYTSFKFRFDKKRSEAINEMYKMMNSSKKFWCAVQIYDALENIGFPDVDKYTEITDWLYKNDSEAWIQKHYMGIDLKNPDNLLKYITDNAETFRCICSCLISLYLLSDFSVYRKDYPSSNIDYFRFFKKKLINAFVIRACIELKFELFHSIPWKTRNEKFLFLLFSHFTPVPCKASIHISNLAETKTNCKKSSVIEHCLKKSKIAYFQSNLAIFEDFSGQVKTFIV